MLKNRLLAEDFRRDYSRAPPKSCSLIPLSRSTRKFASAALQPNREFAIGCRVCSTQAISGTILP